MTKGTKYALSKFGVDEASSEFIIQAVAVRAEKLQATEEYFGERRSGLDQEYNANTRRISSFRYSENGNIYDKISPLSDLKTITPFVIMDINPLMKSYGLGSSWKSVNDAFYNDSDNDGEEEFHDGLWNRIYSARIIFGIGRDFMLSENTRSRFYLGMDYSNALYNGPDSDISLVRSFFDVIPEGADGFVVSSPLQLQQTLLSPSLVFKSFLKNNIGIDLGIRYNQSTGDLLLFKSELQNGFKWSQDRVEYLSKEYTPSAFVKIGLSYYGNHRSLSITTWAEYMSIRHDTNPSFPIVNTNSQSPLVVGNNSYLRWGFGMNFGF